MRIDFNMLYMHLTIFSWSKILAHCSMYKLYLFGSVPVFMVKIAAIEILSIDVEFQFISYSIEYTNGRWWRVKWQMTVRRIKIG